MANATATEETAERPAEPTARELREQKWAAMADQIVAMRDGEQKVGWKEISSQLGIQQGRAMWLYDRAKLDDSERISLEGEELGKEIARLRDQENVSWHTITVRTGLGHSKVHKLYSDATGKDYKESRLEGKGGRYAAGAPRPEPKPKATRSKAVKLEATMDDHEIVNSVIGKTVTYKKGNDEVTASIAQDADAVQVVRKGDKAGLKFTDVDGKNHNVGLTNVTKVSR